MVRVLASLLVGMPLTAFACIELIHQDGFESGVICGNDPNLRLAVAAAPMGRSVSLGASAQYIVRVKSCGYNGNVSLGATQLPNGWSASYPQSLIALVNGEVHETTLTVSVPSNATAACVLFAATAQVSVQEVASTELLLDVENIYLVVEPAGTGTGTHPYPPVITVKAGATVRFRNDDSTPHVLHGDGIIPHEPTFNGEPGRIFDVITNTPGTTGSFYCHSHEQNLGAGQLFVE